MKPRLLKTIGLALLCIVGASNAWADNSKTITVKDQTTSKGSTVTRTDEVIVAYTNANDAIWYLGDYDLSSISSIDVIGAAFVSNGETKAELKLAWMDVSSISSIGEVDTDYLSTNSSSIRSSAKMLAKIVAETTPTTIESGKNATNYAGANFNITSSAVTKTGTYAGTVSEGTHQAINKTSGIVHLFVYGTAGSRRLAVNQIKINFTGTGVYNKTTNVEFSKINDAFNYLTDADTELEVNSDQTLTGRCTWNKAHSLTITPMADITIKGPNNAGWFWTTVNSAALTIGSDGHSITFDGDSKKYSANITRRETNSTLTLKNVAFENFDFNNNANALVNCNNSSGNIILDGVTINNCTNTSKGFIYSERTVNGQITLKDYLNLDATSYASAPAICSTNKSSSPSENGSIIVDDDSFTASFAPLKISWDNAPTAIGYGPLVTGIDGLANATDLFDFYDASYGFYADGDNLKLTQAYTLSVTAANAATLVLPFASTIPTGASCYTLTHTDGTSVVTATPVATTLSANTPVLVNATGSAEGTNYKFVSTATSGDAATGSSDQTSGALTGVFSDKTFGTEIKSYDNIYILNKIDDSVGFYKAASGKKVGANRAYLTATNVPAGARLGIVFDDDETTGIENLTPTLSKGNGAYYNLSGRRVAQPTRGLYIVNGKKVVIK